MKITWAIVVAGLLPPAAVVAAAQHQHHGAAPSPAAAEMTMCAQVQPAIARTMDAAMARLESARQTNSAADLRAAVDDMQALLRDLRRQLEPCAALQQQAADPHAGHTAAAPSEVIDPVCGMKVDPKTAPKATHEGKTYYFCTEDDRQAFLKNPSKYIK